jgi:hypothetical protein
MNELSKYLCLLLRHQPEKAELDMDEHGWVSVEQLINGVNGHSNYKLDRELLEQIVAEDNKGRYRYDEKHEKIKCCQEHSVPWVEPELEYCEPPEFLYHGTTTKALGAIEESGAIRFSVIVILYTVLVLIHRAFHALACILPFYGSFSRFCVIWSYATFSLYRSRLCIHFTGLRRSCYAGRAAVL